MPPGTYRGAIRAQPRGATLCLWSDQGSANNNIDEEESLDDGRDGPRDSFGPAAAPSEPQRSSKETARVAKRTFTNQIN